MAHNQVSSTRGNAQRMCRLGNQLMACIACATILISSGHTQTPRENAQLIDSLDELPVGLGALPEPPIPSDNPQTMKKIELGRRLFFEKQLSAGCEPQLCILP